MSTMSTIQPASSRPATSPLVKLEKNYWRYITSRWVSFLWRASLWPIPVTFVLSTLFLDRGYLVYTTLLACPFFVFVYPLLAVRRSFITNPSREPSASSSFGLLASSVQARKNVQLVGAYVLVSVAYTGFYCYFSKASHDLGLFSPTQRHPWHLNERVVFLLLGTSLFGIREAYSEIAFDRLKPVWPAKKAPFGKVVWTTLSTQLETLLDTSTVTRTVTTLWGSLTFTVLYYILHKWIWRQLLWLTFGSIGTFVANFTRSSRSNLSIGLLSHLLNIELFVILITKIPISVMMPYIVQPIDFDALTRKSGMSPERCLLLALESKDTYYLNFTLMELLRIVHIRDKRKLLFADTATNSQPDLTTAIWQELLVHLGRINQSITTRGGTRTAMRPTAASSRLPASDTRAIPLQSGAIFRPAVKQRSGLQTMFTSVLDGPIQPAPQIVNKAKQIESDLQKRTEKAAQGALEWVERKPVSGPVLKKSTSWLDSQVWSQLGKEWARRNVVLSLGDMVLAQRIIEIFVVLSVASLEEDTYGHVQHVLPATLEAMVRFRGSIVALESELLAQAGTIGKPGQVAGQQVKEILSSYIGVCENGIRRISEGYGTSMSAFRFPPSIASALGEICKE